MDDYIIFFNQQWVGEHSDEWFASRGPLARAVVEEMKAAGVYVYAAGVDEDIDSAVTADATSGSLVFVDGPKTDRNHYLGGLTIVRVESEDQARFWTGKVAQACGWPQEMRRLY